MKKTGLLHLKGPVCFVWGFRFSHFTPCDWDRAVKVCEITLSLPVSFCPDEIPK